jgi:hypothetical protein
MTELDQLDRLIRDRVRAPGYRRWRTKIEATGGCAQPIRLTGIAQLIRPDGTTVHQHSGGLLISCGNRRASVCEACSRRYAADAFHLMRAGLSGGHKHIPTTITSHPRMFLTLTAPSFGPVHTRRLSPRGHVIPCGCGEHHHPADPRVGAPLDPESYDYVGAVLWQVHAGQLWARFTTAVRRALAGQLGVAGRCFGHHARLSYAKVAEYQRRGLVHFHAAIRLDGPAGPGDPPPEGITGAQLREAILRAARSASLSVARPDGTELAVQWGAQLDIRAISATVANQIEDGHGHISEGRLAGYIAKYATKGTGATDTTDRPIRSEHHINHLQLSPHHEQIIRTAWHLGGLAQYADLNLRKWAHMLGFRGHFLTKSQHYSTTFTAIKTERRTHRLHQLLTQYGHPDDNPATIAVVAHWQLTGIGHRDQAERELAQAIASRSTSPRNAKGSDRGGQ